jgi:hypothetical protein
MGKLLRGRHIISREEVTVSGDLISGDLSDLAQGFYLITLGNSGKEYAGKLFVE